MALNNINFGIGVPLTQSTEGMAAAASGTPGSPLLFLQQLFAQLQGLAGGKGEELPADFQALLKNGALGEKGDEQGALDALKAALAALQAGKGQRPVDGGNALPVDDASPGSILPEEMAAMLAGSPKAGGNTSSLGDQLNNKETSGKGENPSPPSSADGQASPMPMPVVAMPPAMTVADPSPSPAPKSNPDFSSPFGFSAKSPAEAANTVALQGAVDRGPAPVRPPQPTALMENLEAAAKRESASLGSNTAAEVANVADNLAAAKGDGFANALASVAAGGGANPFTAADVRAPVPPAPPPVATPMGQPGWHQELGDRIVWMTGKSLDSASIHLNPPHLGPLEVRISMSHDQQASIQFVSEHAVVREAIEAAVPRLREMMGNQQVILVDVNVSNQSAQQQSAQRDESRQQNPQQFAFTPPGQGPETEEAAPADVQRVVRTSNGVLSLYA